MAARKRIGVHNGKFHADDTLSVYFLHQTREFWDAEVVRTRDPTILEACDCVVDVGGEYNHERRRYDHHQPGCNEHFSHIPIPMASCGLVYRHFGREVITNILKRNLITVSESDIEFIYETLYQQFVQEIDAIDNGVSPTDSSHECHYSINTDICSRIAAKNPHWKTPNPDPDSAFIQAVAYIGTEFEYLVMRNAKYGLEELELTRAAYAKRFELDPSGKIMEIPRFYQYLHCLKVVEGDSPQVVFLIYPREDFTWSIRAVGTGWSFKLRQELPFAGLPPKEISEKSGIPGAIYSHKRAFITIYDTREHAVEFAKLAIRE